MSGADGRSIQHEAMTAALADEKKGYGYDANMDEITNRLFNVPLGLPVDP